MNAGYRALFAGNVRKVTPGLGLASVSSTRQTLIYLLPLYGEGVLHSVSNVIMGADGDYLKEVRNQELYDLCRELLSLGISKQAVKCAFKSVEHKG
jgi:hypothetical protein